MAQSRSSRIAYIDGWRVIAVICVIAAHLSQNMQIGLFFQHNWIGIISQYGEVGVFIFFFISGYVVSITCIREAAESRAFSISAFYVRRVFRIIPPLMIYLIVCLLLGMAHLIDFSIWSFLSSASYLCNTSFVECGWYGGHTWSLAFEEQFYLVFPILFSYFELGRKPNFLRLSAILLFSTMPFFFSIFWIGKTGFVVVYALFSIGYLSAKYDNAISRLTTQFRFRGIVFLTAAIIVFMPLKYILPFLIGDLQSDFDKFYKFCYIFAVPLMVLMSGSNGFALKNILSMRYISYFGRATYSIYLWQQLVTGRVFQSESAYIMLILLTVMVLLCVSMYELVEFRFIKMGRKISTQIRFASQPMKLPNSRLEPDSR